MHRYIKVPLFFGLFQALLYLFMYWPEWHHAVSGFVAGTLTGFLLVLIHGYSVKRVAKDVSQDSFDVHQKRTVLLHVPYEIAFDLCREALSVFISCKIKEENRAAGKVKARTGISSNTLGCIISCEIQKVGDQLTRIEVSSRPIVRAALVDYGENLENVEKINEFLCRNDRNLDIKAISSKLNDFVEPEFDKRTNQTVS
jgi:hypothetical protein